MFRWTVVPAVLAIVAGLPGAAPAAAEPAGREPVVFNAGDPTPGAVSYTTVASRCDTVVDDEWTVLTGANNVDVGCVSHFDLVSDRSVFDRVLQAVTR